MAAGILGRQNDFFYIRRGIITAIKSQVYIPRFKKTSRHYGDIRIDGEIEGNILSKGKVVVGPNGKVIGEVICVNSEVSGAIEGKIKVSELLSLKSSSKLIGDIHTAKLTIEPGAIFTGKCEMGGEAKAKSVSGNIKQ